MKDLISIIVPIYNCSECLPKCIESILNQTYSNIEIILVDDGSIDDSGSICDFYGTTDNRIKVIHKDNKGVSSARNSGIKFSKGKYLFFIDADDYIENNIIEILYYAIKNNNADVATCNVYRVDEKGKILFRTFNDDKLLLTSDEYMCNIFSYDNAYCYPINKLYKAELLKKNYIVFNENLHYMEDFNFICEIITKAKKIVNLQDCLYYYVQRKGSATHSKFNKKWLTRFDIQKELINKYLEKFSEKTKQLFLYDFIMNTLSCYSFCKKNKIVEVDYRKYKEESRKYYNYVKKAKYLPKDKKIKVRLKYNFPMLYYQLLEIKNKY